MGKISLGTSVEEVANSMVNLAKMASTTDNWEGYKDICMEIVRQALSASYEEPATKENQA